MQFCLLTRFHNQHENSSFIHRLVEEATRKGHTFHLVNPEDITLAFDGKNFPVRWQGRDFPQFDLIHYALRWDDEHTWEVIDALRMWGRKVMPATRVPMGDSITMARLVARKGIRTARTWVLSSPEQLPIILPELPFPCVFKVRKGGSGRKIYIANHTGEALQVAEGLAKSGFSFVVQEILPPTGTDVRVFVVGDQIVAAVERLAHPTFMRPKEEGNLRLHETKLQPAEIKLVKSAMQLYAAPYAAVSILRREDEEPVLLELSRAPALGEVEATTGVNIAARIIDYCVTSANAAVPTPSAV